MYSLFTDDNGGGGVLTETYIHIEKLVIFFIDYVRTKIKHQNPHNKSYI